MVCSKFIPKKKELRSLMLQFIYSCPLHVVSIAMAIAIAIWGYARRKLYGKRWNIANALLACGMVMAILCITIMGRTTGERILVLKPFASLAAARTQSEAYRELLMNIFLFFPFGLTLSNALPQSWGRWRRIGLTVITGLLLSAGIEYIQYRFALGVAETDDVICNTLGTFIGSTSLLIAHGIEKYNEKTIKHDSNKS